MTLALDRTDGEPLPTAAPTSRVGVNAGCSIPAAALDNRELAAWIRSHGVSVTARDDHDLDLVQFHNIKAVQVVFRCGYGTDVLRRAVAVGASRFIVSSAHHMARISECAHATKYLHLDEAAPLMLGDRRLRVVGLHTDVTEHSDVAGWSSAVQRLLARAAVLNACGATVKRITLSGGPTHMWLGADHPGARAIADAVDRALSDECRNWALPRPAVTLAALTN
ncbi:hypothetical protein BVC93_25130 [Mycobacterium sp. MS1601]|uniref:hypothetical protein n=1 Tax=Mycobacterium sp. MS1601 TaxID=1936029 RepID=UPI0009793041|nr:hypothetical protein [Mycobacterium sp. MS1601]AQA05143.1 hypothetical protein BVC93_25130 [Mycobacterium sp. MS1601]